MLVILMIVVCIAKIAVLTTDSTYSKIQYLDLYLSARHPGNANPC